MNVSALSMLFMAISVIIQIGLPVFLFIYFYKKFDAKYMPMVYGIFGFVVFALILEGSIHRIVFGKFALAEKPAVYIIYAIFMAGIFEESARFIFFKILKRKYSGIGTGLAYGIGHGGAESILLAGVSMVISIISSIVINTGNIEFITGKFQGDALAAINNQLNVLLITDPYLFLISGIERMMAICVQLSLSVIVFYSVFGQKKFWLFPLAILIHAAVNIPAAAFQVGVLKNIFLVEGLIFISAIALALFAKYLHDKIKQSTA